MIELLDAVPKLYPLMQLVDSFNWFNFSRADDWEVAEKEAGNQDSCSNEQIVGWFANGQDKFMD